MKHENLHPTLCMRSTPLASWTQEEELVNRNVTCFPCLRSASLRQGGVGFQSLALKRPDFRALGEGTNLYLFIVFSSNYIITLEGGLTSEQKQQSKQGKIVTGQSSYYLFSPRVCVCARTCAHARTRSHASSWY